MARKGYGRAAHADYERGTFLVTISGCRRAGVLGRVRDGLFRASELGGIVERVWRGLMDRWAGTGSLALQVMPNHAHTVVSLAGGGPRLGVVVGAWKACVTREARRRGLWPADRPLWNRGFHDRILTSPAAVERAIRYVRSNPKKWR